MTTLKLEIINAGEQVKEPIPDDQWLIPEAAHKAFRIERATIVKFDDGRYPQVQFVAKDKTTGKYIALGTTARLLNMVMSAAKGAAESQGLYDF